MTAYTFLYSIFPCKHLLKADCGSASSLVLIFLHVFILPKCFSHFIFLLATVRAQEDCESDWIVILKIMIVSLIIIVVYVL